MEAAVEVFGARNMKWSNKLFNGGEGKGKWFFWVYLLERVVLV